MGNNSDIKKIFSQKFKEMRKEKEIPKILFGDPPIDNDACGDKKTHPSNSYLRIATRKTVGEWESGRALPSLETAIELCNLFDCDFEYLFGEQKIKRKTTADLMEQTGLNQEAVERLKMYKFDVCNAERYFLEDLLCYDFGAFWSLSHIYAEYKSILNCKTLSEMHTGIDDYIVLPSGKGFFAYEADREKDYALFRLSQSFIRFAEKDERIKNAGKEG